MAEHPEVQAINMICRCGNKISLLSTLKNDVEIDVCNKCHNFFIGANDKVNLYQSKLQNFKKRYGSINLIKDDQKKEN